MGIQPIDLQTVYAQMEKIGKQQGAEQSGIISNREKQEEANKIDAERRLNTVKDSDGINNDKLSINENTKRGDASGYKSGYKKKKHADDVVEENDDKYIKDPKLGVRVDISG